MTLSKRIVIAILIVVVDLVAFAVPLSAIAIAYVVLARPARCLRWVVLLYDDRPDKTVEPNGL
jgi:hypothetical protein